MFSQLYTVFLCTYFFLALIYFSFSNLYFKQQVFHLIFIFNFTLFIFSDLKWLIILLVKGTLDVLFYGTQKQNKKSVCPFTKYISDLIYQLLISVKFPWTTGFAHL